MNLLPAALSAFDRQLFQSMPGNTILLLPDAPRFTIIAATDDYCKTAERRHNELIGKGLFEAFPPSSEDIENVSQARVQASLEQALQQKSLHSPPMYRYDIPNADGTFSKRYWSTVNKPVISPDGEVLYLLHSAEDVTDQMLRKEREEHLKSVEKAYKLFMNVPVIIGVVRGDDYIIDLANEDLLEVWGRGTDVIGKPLIEAIPELTGQGYIELLDNVRKTGKPFYATQAPITLFRNGKEEVLYFNFVYKPFSADDKDPSESSVISVGYDVTAQVLAQRQLEQSQLRWELLANTVPVIVWTSDPDGRVTFFNEHWYHFTGLSEAESIDFGWVKVLHPDDVEPCLNTWHRARESATFYQIEVRYRDKNGQYRWVLARGVPVQDSSGRIEAWFGTSTDIDEQKTLSQNLETLVAERTAELKRSNASLEDFAYAASHDMKEPIRKIHFFAERLKSQLQDRLTGEQTVFFERLENASRRMGLLIDDLLSYSQASIGIPDVEEVDLNKKIKMVLEDLELEIEQKKATITLEPLPVVKGNKRQLQQLFQNLISNALKYSKAGKPPQIQISYKLVDGADFGSTLPYSEKRGLCHQISVKDNGIGFPQADAERIFNVFTRLHGNAEYKGTGVGLSIAQKVVQNHGGYIWAEGVPEQGSVFTVLLPFDAADTTK
jgi:hypothetical protein